MIIKTKLEGYSAGIRLYPFKDAPSAPPAPDPTAVSAAQTQSNVETARKNAEMNRVNQFTPYGNLTYTQRQGSTFDENGYNKALADYQSKQGAPSGSAPVTGGGETTGEGSVSFTGNGGQPTTPGTPQTAGAAPTRDQFTTPGSDQWDAKIELSPDQQRLLDQDNRIKLGLGSAAESGIGRATDAMGKPFDTSQMTAYRNVPQGGGAPAGGGAQNYQPGQSTYTTGLNGGAIQKALPNSDYNGARKSVEDAIYSRVNPQLQRDRNALDVKLSNQGIMPGSEAYKEAIDESDRQANDARYQAVLAGGQEQSRLAGLDLQAGNFANSAQQQDFGQQATNAALNNSVNDTRFSQGLATTNQNNAAQQQNYGQQLASNQQDFSQQLAASQASNGQRQQQLQEEAYLRSLPLNELNALRSGSQVTNPQFSSTPQTNVAPTNVSGDIWNSFNAQNANASNQAAANNSFTSGLFGLGSAALKFSDARLKRNIERIGSYRGIGVYKYDYVWGAPDVGLMAHEVKQIAPEAIGENMGFMTVDYSKV